jgi:alpha-N-acetylglucosamine transferase
MAASGRREAYITMITTKDYIIGALVMAHSLKGSGTTRPILCMVTRNMDLEDLDALRAGGLIPVFVDSIPAPSSSHVREWDNAGYTKLNLWGLVEWDFLVYIDADCLVHSNMDDLFLRYGTGFIQASMHYLSF